MNRSLPLVAKEKLGCKLPEKLRNEIYGVFRIRKDKKADPLLNKWLRLVLKERVSSNRKDIHSDYEASVSNALILIYLMGNGVKAQELMTAKFASRDSSLKKYSDAVSGAITFLRHSENARGFEFAVLGVIPERKERVIERLLCEDFDILKDHLPSPFEGSNISIIADHYAQEFPWGKYRDVYDQAQNCFEDGDLETCIASLETLVEGSLIRIPVAEELLLRARRKLAEHQELRAVIGKI